MAQFLEASGKFMVPRKERFPENFLRDLEILVEQLTQEISETHIRDGEYATNLNIYLAFFLHDAFSLLDRGFVFGLLKLYLKKVGAVWCWAVWCCMVQCWAGLGGVRLRHCVISYYVPTLNGVCL